MTKEELQNETNLIIAQWFEQEGPSTNESLTMRAYLAGMAAAKAKLPMTVDAVSMYPGMRVWCIDHLSYAGDDTNTIESALISKLDVDGWWFDEHWIPKEDCYSSHAAAYAALTLAEASCTQAPTAATQDEIADNATSQGAT